MAPPEQSDEDDVSRAQQEEEEEGDDQEQEHKRARREAGDAGGTEWVGGEASGGRLGEQDQGSGWEEQQAEGGAEARLPEAEEFCPKETHPAEEALKGLHEQLIPDAGFKEATLADLSPAKVAGGDLDVIIEGSTLRVHSQLLELASPVFAERLRAASEDGPVRGIELPGKRRREFELFLEFLRPLSRHRINVSNVDAMLPWCDEYQVISLKEECEEILLRMPVSGARLVQARVFGLHKQYQRCLKELTAAQFQSDFEELVSVPGAVQELLPLIRNKAKELDHVFAFLQKLLDAGVDLRSVMPILQVCFRNASVLQPGMLSELPLLLSGTPDFKKLSTTLLEKYFVCESAGRAYRQRAKGEVHALADLATGRQNQYLRDRILEVADRL